METITSKIELVDVEILTLRAIENGFRDGWERNSHVDLLIHHGFIMPQQNKYFITSLGKNFLLEQNKIEG